MVANGESPNIDPEASPDVGVTPNIPEDNAPGVPVSDVMSTHGSGLDAESVSASGSAGGDYASPALAAEFAAMKGALERFHGRAEQYESIIRRMQGRIEELQADQIRELLKPVILKLASLHTVAMAAEERASARDDDASRKDFDYFVSEIEESLGLLDIESIGVSVLDEFDAARHAARRRVDTDDASLDRRIAKVLRQGFTFVGAERTFIPAQVTVYRHASSGHAEPAVADSADNAT